MFLYLTITKLCHNITDSLRNVFVVMKKSSNKLIYPLKGKESQLSTFWISVIQPSNIKQRRGIAQMRAGKA